MTDSAPITRPTRAAGGDGEAAQDLSRGTRRGRAGVGGVVAMCLLLPGAAIGSASPLLRADVQRVDQCPPSPPDSDARFDMPVGDGLDEADVRAVEVTSDGAVWMSVRGEGLARVRDDEIEWFTVDDGLVSDGVVDLHQDAHGRLWAVGMGGYSVFDGARWTAHTDVGDLAPRVVFGIHEVAGTDTLWLAANGGAAKLEDGAWSVVRRADGLPHAVVHAVVVDRAGVVWLGCRTGLARLDDGEISVLFEGLNIRSAIVDADGNPWFGTNDGVYAWDGSEWHRSLEARSSSCGRCRAPGRSGRPPPHRVSFATTASRGSRSSSLRVWRASRSSTWPRPRTVPRGSRRRAASCTLPGCPGRAPCSARARPRCASCRGSYS